MVEKLTKEEILYKLSYAHKNNPCYNDEIKNINLSSIENMSSIEEVVEFIDTPKCYKSILINVSQEIFSISKINQKDMNIFFYKYLYLIMLTDPKTKNYEEIKIELFNYFINLCRKNGEEELSNRFKLCKLFIFFCCSALTFCMYTIIIDAFYEGKKSESEIIDVDNNVNSFDYILKASAVIEKKLKGTFPDYHAMRVFAKMVKLILKSLKNNFSITLDNFDENNFDQLIYLSQENRNLFEFESNSEYKGDENDIAVKKTENWYSNIPKLTKEDIELASKNFANINISEIIFNFNCFVDFSYQKVSRDIGE